MNLIRFVNKYCDSRPLKPTSVYQLKHAAASFSKSTGVTRTRALTREAIMNYARSETGRLSPHTIKARVARLSGIWRSAAAAGLAPEYERVPSHKAPRMIIRATPPQTVERLVRACQNVHGKIRGTSIPRNVYWPAFAAASYETLLRTSDLLQLRWSPVGRWSLIQIKTGNPVTVSVWPDTLELVKRLADVSPTLFDLGWSREWYCRGLQSIARRAGIVISPQQLRRSAASEAERQRPGTAYRLLGHVDQGTTQRWYLDHGYVHDGLRGPRIQRRDTGS